MLNDNIFSFKVDLSTVKATGKNGRILKEDMLSHLNMSSDSSNDTIDDTSIRAVEMPVYQTAKVEMLLEDRVVPISGFTRAMVKTMTEAMVSNLKCLNVRIFLMYTGTL